MADAEIPLQIMNGIRSAIQSSFQTVVETIALQNHLYGCFVILESIAEKSIDMSGTVLMHVDISQSLVENFDTDADFADIGLEYGFASDSRLQYKSATEEYKKEWLQLFKETAIDTATVVVDKLEETIFGEIIQAYKGSDRAYFENALATGSLTPEWQAKLLENLKDVKNGDRTPVAVEATKQVKEVRRRRAGYAKTRRMNGRRALTPISRKRVTASTRRRHVIVL